MSPRFKIQGTKIKAVCTQYAPMAHATAHIVLALFSSQKIL